MGTGVRESRCLRLAHFLGGLRPEQIDMGVWLVAEPGCGTVACAGGWACLVPSLRLEGLRFTENPSAPWLFTPSFEDYYGLEALEAFFGLDHATAVRIFLKYSYRGRVTPARVARRIRLLVVGRGRAAAC